MVELPKACAGCGGRSVLLRFDGVYYFTSCEQCEKSGPRANSPEEAVGVWNADSSTMFLYGEDLRKSRILKRLECQDRRDDRCSVDIPIVFALGGEKGRKVTGLMRNVSFYGAFLELTGGDLSAMPIDIEGFKVLDTFVFFKLPKRFSDGHAEELRSVQVLKFSPRHIHQRREIVGVGGCFVQPKREQMDVLGALVERACIAEE